MLYFIPFSPYPFLLFLSQKIKERYIHIPYRSLSRFGCIGENCQDFVDYFLQFLGMAMKLGAELSCVSSFSAILGDGVPTIPPNDDSVLKAYCTVV